ncbi:PIR protein, putative [Plasmodium sp.]|nr:PIR protein, putative [Plasmodium sp.]
MKVHYINILIFALPLNILVYNKRNHERITHHTTNENSIKTYRSLCECELYALDNYDNDPEMKAVIQDFDRQTSKRFKEYDERMMKNRQKCKEQCEKDIKKIILKDKIKKELAEKFVTLETNIHTNDIPTCVCKKSVEDKVEKTCLKCGGVLAGGVAPEFGLIGGTALYAISVWKPTAITAAIEAAEEAGAAAGKIAGDAAGVADLIAGLKNMWDINSLVGKSLESLVTKKTYTDYNLLATAFKIQYKAKCMIQPDSATGAFCSLDESNYAKVIEGTTKWLVGNANKTAKAVTTDVTASETVAFKETNIASVEAICNSYNTAIIASIVAIFIIILVMVIIYLILRYRRKKKMKKKLQYIKLLKQ